MGQPAARVGDMHVCPMVTGVVPHVGGPILPPCIPTVLTGGMPQARASDMCTCVGPPDVIIPPCAATVLVGNLPAARMGDMTAHGGVIVMGCFTVLIGSAAGGGGGAGGGMGTVALGLEKEEAASKPQAQAMIAAAKDGTPFCEICTRGAA